MSTSTLKCAVLQFFQPLEAKAETALTPECRLSLLSPDMLSGEKGDCEFLMAVVLTVAALVLSYAFDSLQGNGLKDTSIFSSRMMS